MIRNVEQERYDSLRGKYKHYCPDWDYMVIDETCPEFECCLCKFTEEEKCHDADNSEN